MAKKSRKSRKADRQAHHGAARSGRQKRKEIRQAARTQRVQNRHNAKTDRQDLRHEGRAENLKTRIHNRKKELKQKNSEVEKDLQTSADQMGSDVSQVATDRLNSNAEQLNEVKNYVAKQSGRPSDELEGLNTEDLAGMAVELRAEEIEDVREPISSEIQEEGDTLEEEFEDFEFYNAALHINADENPEGFEDFGVISPDTWALVSGAAKGGAEIIAQKRFEKNKKFLGMSEKEWKAPANPNDASEILKRETIEPVKANQINDNIGVIIIVAIVLAALIYFATKKK